MFLIEHAFHATITYKKNKDTKWSTRLECQNKHFTFFDKIKVLLGFPIQKYHVESTDYETYEVTKGTLSPKYANNYLDILDEVLLTMVENPDIIISCQKNIALYRNHYHVQVSTDSDMESWECSFFIHSDDLHQFAKGHNLQEILEQHCVS